jgi:PAS domain S-box-containing protein
MVSSASDEPREVPAELYRTLTAHLPDVAVFLLDRELRILLAEGEGWRRLPWFDETMFRGQRVDELYGVAPKEVLDLAVEHYRAAAAGERREFSFVDAGRTIEIVAAPVRHSGDAVVAVVARDVTEQAQAREIVLRARELYRTVAGNIPGTSVGLLNEQLEWVLIEGDEVLSGVGVERDAVVGQRLNSVDESFGDVVRPFALGALEGKAGETQWQHPAGRAFSLRIAPVLSPEGQPNVLVVVSDITEQRAAEERYRRLNEQFERSFAFAPIGMILVDARPEARGVIARANDAFCEMLGYPPGALDGEPVATFAHPDDLERIERNQAALADGSVDRISLERRYISATGEEVTAWLTASLLPSTGDERWLLAHVQDLTDRRKAEEARERARAEEERLQNALHQYQKLETVGQLAGGVAHDFNNLLTVIMHSADFALAQLDDHPAREEIEEIQSSAQRAAALTRQLLMFGRQEISQPRTVDLNELIRNVEGLLRRTIGEHIELEVELAQGRLVVRVDPNQLEHGLLNLAVNARDAMPDGGTLRVSTRAVDLPGEPATGVPAGPHIEIAVSDTGVGMSEDVRARAVDPFFTTKPLASGTGLGLATTYGIVRESGGHLLIESSEGAGTVVRVLLPPAAEGAVPQAPEEEAAAPPGRGGCVLVVEDEESLLRAAVRILSSGGYEVIAASGGEEALELAPRADVVLTDVVMPGMSGTELAARLRETAPDLPVIFMSGYTNRPGRLPRNAAFVGKPFSKAAVLSAVAAAFERD